MVSLKISLSLPMERKEKRLTPTGPSRRELLSPCPPPLDPLLLSSPAEKSLLYKERKIVLIRRHGRRQATRLPTLRARGSLCLPSACHARLKRPRPKRAAAATPESSG